MYLVLFLLTLTRAICAFNESFYSSEELPSRYNPPKLNIVNRIQEIKANDTFEVECLGNKPLEWRIYQAQDDIGNRLNFTESVDMENKDFQFSSKLFLFDAQYTDTSYFSCFYNGTNVDHLSSNPLTMASFYLYVNDDDHLFVPVPFITKGSNSRALVIPCRPTNSRVNVTLWKKEGDTKQIDLEEDRIEFDPTRGFSIYYPAHLDQSYFECHGTFGEVEDKVHTIVVITKDIYSLPQPMIKEENATFVSIGTTFSLTCEVELDDPSIYGQLFWEYPNSQENNSTGRIIAPQFTRNKDKKGIAMLWSAKLLVHNAKMSDEGNYICIVKVEEKTNNNTFRVTVHENEIMPFINIKQTKNIVVNENSPVKMVFDINSTFSLPDLEFLLRKDGEVITNGKRYNVSETSVTHNMHQKILRFNNCTREDSGNYTLTVWSGEITDTVSLSLYVRVPPLTYIENMAKFYTVDKEYKFDCIVDGFPNIAIWFERRQCNPCTSNDDWQKLNETNSTENKESMSVIDRSVPYKPRMSLTLIAKQSGEYRCVGQNRWGTSNQDIRFIVSDIDKGFALIPAKEKPIQGDNVTICCKANKITYSNLTWYTVTLEGERHSLPIDAKVTALETQYSYELYLTFPKIGKDFSENFTCVAKDIESNETKSVRYHLSVQNAIAPKFLSNSKRTFNLKNMDHASLNCSATGIPFPNISWLKDGKILPNSTSVLETTTRGQILRIKVAVKESVEGTYKCVVKNRMGVESRTFEVSVEEKISIVTISLAVCLPVLMIALFIACFCCIRHIHLERREKAELEALSRELFNKGEVHLLNPDLPLDDQVELLPYDHKWEFPKDRLKLGRILGQGAFGRVVKAEAIGLDEEGTSTVAVKMLKERADKTQRKALMAELKILIHLGKHLNIVNLLGAVTTNMKKGELLVIVEYCRYGNLRNYLLKRKHNFINQLSTETGQIDPNLAVLPGSPLKAQLAANQGLSNPIYGQHKVNYADLMHNENPNSDYSYDVTTTVPNSPNTATSFKGATFRWLSVNEDDGILQTISTCDLLCYAFQVARGMQYLSSRKLLHRDLAARNVLLADDNIVKICDFGLAKDCYKCDNYKIQGNGPLPIKWMALESLEDRVFTTKSDIWSYGILLWEFFTLGGDPYPGMDLDEEFYKRLKTGYRMDKPEYAPDNVYRIMLQCWDEAPEDRPSFEVLGDTFGDLLHAGVKDFYLELDSQYAEMNALNKGTDYLAMSKSDYLSMGTEESEQTDVVHYDNVNSIRPVDDGPVTREPMEVIPMIQLEPVNVKRHKSKGRPAPEEPVTDTRRETDYLLMNGDKSVFSRQRKGNESLRSDASSGFHSDLDTSSETNPPPSYNLVMEEENVSIEV